MANIRLIKNRIKSAKNISQITRAMELVAASKMRKAQAAAAAGKLYAAKIRDMVSALSSRTDSAHHPLLSPPAAGGKRFVILMSTNKGLCGGLNTNLFRFMAQEYSDTSGCTFVSFGKKGTHFLTQIKGELKADFSEQVPFVDSVPAVTDMFTREYLSGAVSGVDLVYNEFVSALTQVPVKKSILPLAMEDAETKAALPTGEFLIEPSIPEVFDRLLPHYLENQVRDALLQAEASEHSARMVAMRNATDNALSFMDELTILYNKARQEKITYEIADIVTARLATE
ncbi:MAG: ATP synthase gamma chain [Microgenomates group bacterium GW2011_GWC1_49_7]|nr:MAG: ATP synthase gamma chain [Microgenomates group bacterium GW2011_GWC1_49_7]